MPFQSFNFFNSHEIIMVFWSRLQLISVFLSLPMIEVSCNENVGKILNEALGYDFNKVPEIDTVLIWNITSRKRVMFTPVMCTGMAIQFGSYETYLLLSRTRSGITIHYWLGRITSLVDKKLAAKWAVTLALFPKVVLPDYKYFPVKIFREIEEEESGSFMQTVTLSKKRGTPNIAIDMYRNELFRGLSIHRFDLYIVRGEEHSFIKKIPASLGLLWLTKRDTCLVLVVGYAVKGLYPVIFSCGIETNEMLRQRAAKLCSKFNYDVSDRSMYTHLLKNKRESKYQRFIEALEDSTFYNPKEVDNSADHLKSATEFCNSRNAEVLLLNATDDGLKINPSRPIRRSIFQWDSMTYLLDTKSIAGVYLVFSDSEKLRDRVNAIHLAEEYMYDTYPALLYGYIMNMMIIENVYVKSTNLILNWADFPPKPRGLPGDEELW